MLKFFVLSAVLALAASNDITPFTGEFRAVKIFDKEAAVQDCEPFTITDEKIYCKCGSDDKVSKVKLQLGSHFVSWPAYYVDSFQAVTESLKTQCTCDGKNAGHYTFWKLTDNYFVVMFTRDGTDLMVLVAKELESQAQIDEVINNNEFLKTKTSFFVCSNELLHSEHKSTTGVKWWVYNKNH